MILHSDMTWARANVKPRQLILHDQATYIVKKGTEKEKKVYWLGPRDQCDATTLNTLNIV